MADLYPGLPIQAFAASTAAEKVANSGPRRKPPSESLGGAKSLNAYIVFSLTKSSDFLMGRSAP